MVTTDKRLVVTLSPSTGRTVREMASDMGCNVAETIRRSLSLMRVWLSLEDGEALLVRRRNGDLERIVLWLED